MKYPWVLATLLFTASLLLAAQEQPGSTSFLDSRPTSNSPEAAQTASTHEDEIYSSATKALNDGKYDQAILGFDEVAGLRGRKADGALYWKAYVLHKVAQNQSALSTIDYLKRNYPQSRWLHDAEAIGVEIRGPENGKEDPGVENDDEIKILALNGVLEADPERGLASAQKLLQGNSSLRVKERVLFVLAQSNSEKAHETLLSIAKGGSQSELQEYAVHWLAVSGGDRNKQILRDIYAASTNPKVKEQVLHSFIINGDKEGLLNIIHKETSPELRQKAIRQLGPMGATAELRQIYKDQHDAETKKTILQAMGVAGDRDGLTEIAKTETDPEVRAHAIRSLGVFGGEAAVPVLASIYDSNADLETKKQVVRALFIHGAATEMVALAKHETNPELKKEIVRNLSLMHSTEATDYMMELLNK